MKLIHIVSTKFPSKNVDNYYVKSMALGFFHHLKDDFTFVIRGEIPEELMGVRVLTISMPKRYVRTLLYAFKIPFLILKNGWNKSDTVFFAHDPNILLILILTRKLFRFKYILCSDWHHLFEDWRDKFIASNSDYAVTTCVRLKKFLVKETDIEESKVLVSYGGVDPIPFSEKAKTPKSKLRSQLGVPEDKFLVGYMGSFAALGFEKGLTTIVESLRDLPEDVMSIFVGGPDSYFDIYKELARKHGVLNRCIFVKKQPYDKLIEYELSVDVLAIPYPDKPHFRDYGFPVKVWEYMAAGRPIVYSDLEIIGEILNKRGTPFKPGDAKDFARVVKHVYDNFAETEEVARKNPQEVLSYTWEQRTEIILDFLGKV